MQKIILTFAAMIFSFSIYAIGPSGINSQMIASDSISINQADSLEYDIIITEVGYDNWLITNAQPKWYYTNEYYRNKNQFYVIDWNNRVIQYMGRPPFEEQIFYDPNIDYGLDVNYKLYWYFRFMEHKYDIRLNGGGKGSF
jgi:hypothetical protein